MENKTEKYVRIYRIIRIMNFNKWVDLKTIEVIAKGDK